MYKYWFLKSFLMATVLVFSFCGCVSKHYDSPSNYDFQYPSSMDIPSEMKNFSGITFFHGNASMIYAVDENSGIVYCYYPGNRNLVKSIFSSKDNFEDLAIIDSSIYALKDNGDMYSFPFTQMGQDTISTIYGFQNILPKGTYEAMYADDSLRKMVVISKKRPKEGWVTRGYIFSVAKDGRPYRTGTFKVSLNGIKTKLGREDLEGFHPSAIGQNPKNKDWYIIADQEKVLTIMDKNWNIINAYDLDPKIFSKPQGLVFDKDGNLYVANDGTKDQSPNIQIFQYKNRPSYVINEDAKKPH